MEFYSVFNTVFSFLLSGILLYQMLLCIAAFRKPKTPKENRMHRFAVVVSARNEESVIGYLIDSLHAQEYPAELVDIFLIADNCTDDTAGVAEAKGAKVFRRHDLDNIGKGYALHWFFDQFTSQYAAEYDAVCMFDADNLVEPGFMAEMNRQICAGHMAIMGYRDSKNPHDSWVSGCMSLSFWNISRFYDLPRVNLGLSALVSGTGFVFRTELIQNGWNTTTVCEDTEFSYQIITKGYRIAYAPDAIFYDEQPVDFSTSARQRRRWAVGSYQNIRACVPMLFRARGKQYDTVLIDAGINLFMMAVFAVNILLILVRLVSMLFYPINLWAPIISDVVFSGLSAYVGIFAQAVLVLLLEKKFSVKILKTLFLYPFFVLSTAVIYLYSMFTPTIEWTPIRHSKGVALKQLKKGKSKTGLEQAE